MKLIIVAVVLFLSVVILGVLHVNTGSKLNELETRVAGIQSEQAKAREAIDTEAAKLREAVTAAEANQQKALDAVRADAKQSSEQASRQARKSVDELASHLHASEPKVDHTHDADPQVTSELSELKQAINDTQSSVSAVSSQVNAVKTDVASTKSGLDSAIADLHRTTGDLGLLSGQIATNTKEIEALRKIGDRSYTEFTIFKGKAPVRLADVSILLKNTNPKSNQYSIELQVGDRKIEKKDRTINEPLQFYTDRDSQPHELVVYQVSKDQIVGYLAIPKVASTRP